MRTGQARCSRAASIRSAIGEIAAEHRVALSELVAVSRSLEDAFLELTGGSE